MTEEKENVRTEKIREFIKFAWLEGTAAADALLTHSRILNFSKGEKIRVDNSDAESNNIYVLLDGIVCGIVEFSSGKTLVECVAYTFGAVLNDNADMQFEQIDEQNMFPGHYSQAFEDSTVLSIDGTIMEELMVSVPALALFYVTNLRDCLNLHWCHKIMLTVDAKTRYDWFLKNYASVADRLPVWAVAQFLNMNPATLSRIRSGMNILTEKNHT